jgi:hypothetical protein
MLQGLVLLSTHVALVVAFRVAACVNGAAFWDGGVGLVRSVLRIVFA